jgi:protease IV
MTPAEREQFQYIVDGVHKDFLSTITLNRGLSEEQAEEVGTAKIFLGKDALKLGLVDQLGGFEDAVNMARILGACPDATSFTMGADSAGLYDLSYAFGRGMGDSITTGSSEIDIRF